ncbi:MAG: hypothetical protein HY860_02695 [Chlamydiales bacterium]|nr:hypothetical protein [Chlamydiales bacterium]
MQRFIVPLFILSILTMVFYPKTKHHLIQDVITCQDPYTSLKECMQKQLGDKTAFLNEKKRETFFNQLITLYLLEKGRYEDYALIAMQQSPQDCLSWHSFCQLQQLFSHASKQLGTISLSHFLKEAVFILMLEDENLKDLYTSQLSSLEQCMLSTVLSFQYLEKIASLEEGMHAFQQCQESIVCDCQMDYIDCCFLIGLLQHTYDKEQYLLYPFIGYTETTHLAWIHAKNIVILLKDHSYEDVYDQYMHEHATLLGLNDKDPFYKVVIKLSMMMHLFDKKQAFMIADALLSLNSLDLDRVIDVFNQEQSMSDLKNFSLFLRRLLQHQTIGVKQSESIAKALHIALPILVDSYHEQNLLFEKTHLLSAVEFIEMVKIADCNIDLLSRHSTAIDGNGVICLRR